jgi:2-amino-4-hydroxy-6-hydroxymethyldihydropteridine diphosphokinase
MPRVFLGLGSNIDDKERYITTAISLISEICTVKKKSHLYLTEPVGATNSDWFMNSVIEIETEMNPDALLSALQSIEQQLGRKKTVKNAPRTIDIDILLYDDVILKKKHLVIPHPLLQDRLFVLQPMMDIDPSVIHPVFGTSIRELIKDCLRTEKVIRFK